MHWPVAGTIQGYQQTHWFRIVHSHSTLWIAAAVGTNTYVPSPSDAAGLSGTRIAQARRGAVIMENRLAAQSSDAPQLHLRCRRCTSTHTKAPVGPGSQRSGPGSPRRRPAAAGRLHRHPSISLREWRVGSQRISVAHGPFFATLRQRAIRLRDKSRKIFSFEFAIDQDRTGVLFGPP